MKIVNILVIKNYKFLRSSGGWRQGVVPGAALVNGLCHSEEGAPPRAPTEKLLKAYMIVLYQAFFFFFGINMATMPALMAAAAAVLRINSVLLYFQSAL